MRAHHHMQASVGWVAIEVVRRRPVRVVRCGVEARIHAITPVHLDRHVDRDEGNPPRISVAGLGRPRIFRANPNVLLAGLSVPYAKCEIGNLRGRLRMVQNDHDLSSNLKPAVLPGDDCAVVPSTLRSVAHPDLKRDRRIGLRVSLPRNVAPQIKCHRLLSVGDRDDEQCPDEEQAGHVERKAPHFPTLTNAPR